MSRSIFFSYFTSLCAKYQISDYVFLCSVYVYILRTCKYAHVDQYSMHMGKVERTGEQGRPRFDRMPLELYCILCVAWPQLSSPSKPVPVCKTLIGLKRASCFVLFYKNRTCITTNTYCISRLNVHRIKSPSDFGKGHTSLPQALPNFLLIAFEIAFQ